MPTIAEILLRDHVRYTGDGKPNEPAGMPAPLGDPSSGVHNPSKKDIRDAIDSVTGAADAANLAADRADDSADLIDSALGVNARPLFVLFLGQSNMRGNGGVTGGDMAVPPNTYVWNNYVPPTASGTASAGTAWVPFELGQYPSDQQSGGQYVTGLPHGVMRELHLRTKRRIYAVTVACGGHSIESFLRPGTRVAGGWTLPGGELDLSEQMYPQLATSLAAAPTAPSIFDAVFLHQGEKNANTGDDMTDYRAKVSALFGDLVSQGVANGLRTQFTAGVIAQDNPRYLGHLGALTNNLPGAIATLKIADSRGLVTVDGLHFNGNGVSEMARRMADSWESPLQRFGISSVTPFTPEISGGVTGGLTAGGVINGVCRREGRQVSMHFAASGITTTGMTGSNEVIIRGLPWPITDYVTAAVNIAGATLSGYPVITGEPGNSYLRIAQSSSGNPLDIMRLSDLNSGSASIRFSLNYTTNY